VLTTEAIEDDAQINVSYSPTYQKLVWHEVRLVRNGVASDLLASAEKQLLPLQDDSDMRTLDDRLEWELHLHDIQVGDIIEYSYTVTGGNPIFGDYWSTMLYFTWRDGIGRFYQRVIHPADGPNTLKWKVIGGDQPPTVTTHS
jgi:hypothetical protein